MKKQAHSKLIQEQVELPFNTQIFSKNGDPTGGLLPYELKPKQLKVGFIDFKLEENAQLNGLSCLGQTLELPKGFRKVSILLTAKERTDVEFAFLSETGETVSTKKTRIQSSTGFIGQWEVRQWKRTPKHHLSLRNDYAWVNKCTGVKAGYVHRDQIAWYATHTHKAGQDQAYRYGYIYLKEFLISEDVVELLLPEEKDVVITSLTVSRCEEMVASIKFLNDKYDH